MSTEFGNIKKEKQDPLFDLFQEIGELGVSESKELINKVGQVRSLVTDVVSKIQESLSDLEKGSRPNVQCVIDEGHPIEMLMNLLGQAEYLTHHINKRLRLIMFSGQIDDIMSQLVRELEHRLEAWEVLFQEMASIPVTLKDYGDEESLSKLKEIMNDMKSKVHKSRVRQETLDTGEIELF